MRTALILAAALAVTLVLYFGLVALICPCEWQTYYPALGRIP